MKISKQENDILDINYKLKITILKKIKFIIIVVNYKFTM